MSRVSKQESWHPVFWGQNPVFLGPASFFQWCLLILRAHPLCISKDRTGNALVVHNWNLQISHYSCCEINVLLVRHGLWNHALIEWKAFHVLVWCSFWSKRGFGSGKCPILRPTFLVNPWCGEDYVNLPSLNYEFNIRLRWIMGSTLSFLS